VGIKILSNVTREEFKDVRTIYDLMTLMDKHIMGIIRVSDKAKEVNELLSASDFSGEHAEGAGYNGKEKKKTSAQKHISHFKQSKEDKDDDYEASDMEAVAYHYDSDAHSQDFQSDDEDEARDRLANIKVERKATNPKKVDENCEKFVPRRQAPQAKNPAIKVSIFDNFPNVCYSEWFSGKCMRENCAYHGEDAKAKEADMYRAMAEWMRNHKSKPKDCELILRRTRPDGYKRNVPLAKGKQFNAVTPDGHLLDDKELVKETYDNSASSEDTT
jgi:hypothetical protein